jgi:hypothetical protein
MNLLSRRFTNKRIDLPADASPFASCLAGPNGVSRFGTCFGWNRSSDRALWLPPISVSAMSLRFPSLQPVQRDPAFDFESSQSRPGRLHDVIPEKFDLMVYFEGSPTPPQRSASSLLANARISVARPF